MKSVAIFLLISVCFALHVHELTGSQLSLEEQIALLQPNPTETHSAVQPAHAELVTLATAASVATVVSALNDVVQSVVPLFAVTCKNGYKRGNNINIVNTMSQPIQILDTYMDSGKLINSGPVQLQGNNTVGTWNFVKKSGGATGSTGCLVWQLDSSYRLVVVFQNPWSAYNFAEVCITPVRGTAKFYYNQFYYNKERQNCVRLDNQDSQLDYFYGSRTLQAYGYTFSVFLKYEYLDGCYIQEVDVAIGK